MKRPIETLASIALLAPVAVGLFFSFRYLPPINEMPPGFGEGREGPNWLGRPPWAFLCYVVVLVVAAYALKRLLLVYCSTRLTALYFFSVFVALTLPYIWFLCEPDWFNSFIYRVSCWVGGPIAIWFVPVASFAVSLWRWEKAKPLKHFLIQSGVEVLMIFPLWVVFWTYFSFFILGWGWI